MSIIVCKPGDYRLDDGSEGRLYPIEENSDDSVIMYDDYPQPIAHVQANIVALFSQWFLSFSIQNISNSLVSKQQFRFVSLKHS